MFTTRDMVIGCTGRRSSSGASFSGAFCLTVYGDVYLRVVFLMAHSHLVLHTLLALPCRLLRLFACGSIRLPVFVRATQSHRAHALHAPISQQFLWAYRHVNTHLCMPHTSLVL